MEVLGNLLREPTDAEYQRMVAYARKRPCNIAWDERGFPGDRGLQVQFRQLGQEETEHWLNHAAVALTRWPGDKPPFGNNCHCEIILEPTRGRLVRIATMYKYAQKNRDNPDAPVEWKPGKVFVADINEGDFRKYSGFSVPATRAQQLRLWCFAMRRMETPFHNEAYYLKAISPWSIGVSQYNPDDHPLDDSTPLPPQKYFCAQFVILCLQAAAYEELRRNPELNRYSDYWAPAVMNMRAPDWSPNTFYYALSKMKDLTPIFEPHAQLRM